MNNADPVDHRHKPARRRAKWLSSLPILLLLIAGPAVLAACGSSKSSTNSSGSKGGSGAAAEHHWNATLRLDYTVNGYSVPEVVAEQKGFYSKRGLDLKVEQGAGSGVVTQQTGTGVTTFGAPDMSTAALYIAKGLPVKAVAVFLQTNPNGLAYNGKKITLSSPKDLEGKTLGLVAGEAPYQLLLAASKKNKISESSYKKVFMSVAALPGALLAGKIDAMGAFDVGSFETTKLQDPNLKFQAFAEWGVNPLSIGLLAQEKTIKEDPEEVKALVEGSVEGWEWTIAHPKEAVELAVKVFPEANAKAMEAGIVDAQPLLHTSETENLPLGQTTEKQWNDTVEFDKTYAGLKSDKPASAYYTNEFVE